MSSHCPACCTRRREAGKYLCPPCWRALPAAARRALGRHDGQAFARARELHRQLAAGVLLSRIQITG